MDMVLSPIKLQKRLLLKKYIALNAQVNASNIGYHDLLKYNNIDSLVINETELRHEMRNKDDTKFYHYN